MIISIHKHLATIVISQTFTHSVQTFRTHPSVLQELDFIIYTRGGGHDILGQAQGEG